MIEFCKGLIPKRHGLRHKLRILLVNTMVPRDTKRLVTKVAGLHELYPEVIDHILDAMHAVATNALECLMKINNISADHLITPELLRDYKTLGVIRMYKPFAKHRLQTN